MLLNISIALLVLGSSDFSAPSVFGSKIERQVTNDSYPPCQRPQGEHGRCKLSKDCSSLNIPYDNINYNQYFRHSLCGFQDNLPKVCCPLSPKDKIPKGHFKFVNTSLLPDICGLSTVSKIFGGNKTQLGEFPWMAALEYRMYSKKLERVVPDIRCGGFLISNRYVLTAAHCINDALTYVRLGEHDLATNPDCDQDGFCATKYIRRTIEEKIVFPSYKPFPDKYHDVALLRLNQNVTFTEFVRPVCLPTTVDELFKSYIGESAIVSGWGKTEHGYYSNIKLKVDVPIKKLSECSEFLDEGQLCAGGVGGKGSCFADSGGPLMVTKRDDMGDVHWYAIGIVSGGPHGQCAQDYAPGYYVRVSKYVSWIIDTIRS